MVTVLAALASAVVLVLVTRLTRWGRQFRRLAYPYFSPRAGQGWGPLVNLLAVITLVIARRSSGAIWENSRGGLAPTATTVLRRPLMMHAISMNFALVAVV